MKETKFSEVIESLFKGMETVLSTDTVIGEPKQIGDTIIVPIIDVAFGVGANSGSKEKSDIGLGGMGGKITPSAVLVIQGDKIKLVNVKNQETSTKILDMIPDIVEKITTKTKKDDITEEDVKRAAFGEEN